MNENSKISLDELLAIVECPRTGEALHRQGDWLVNETGSMRYPLVRDVPYLVTRRPETPELLDEYFRYRRFFDKLRHNEYDIERTSLKLEEVKRQVELLRRYFNSVASYINFRSNPLILDTAAGMMETSFELSRRGGRVVATDFSHAELENPRLYSFFDSDNYDWSQFSIVDGYRSLHESEIDFARVLTETEHMPFRDESFDVVFTRSSLHHVKNLRASLAEMSRVVKKGGLLVVAGECIRPPWDSELEYREPELDFQEGIDEQTRTWGEYARATRAAGFSQITAIPMLTTGGLRWQRMLRRMGLYDPLVRFDGRRLSGPSLGLLTFLGCVIGWVAKRTGDPPIREGLRPEGRVPLAVQISRFAEFEDELHREALAANADVPRGYTASTMPRPKCYGFDHLERLGRKTVCKMHSSGCFIIGGRYLPHRAPLLRLYNAGAEEATLEIETFPEGGRKIWTIKPGRNRLRLMFPVRIEAPSVEFHFRLLGAGPVYFHELRR